MFSKPYGKVYFGTNIGKLWNIFQDTLSGDIKRVNRRDSAIRGKRYGLRTNNLFGADKKVACRKGKVYL